MKTIYIQNEEEEAQKLSVSDFASSFCKDNDVPSTDQIPAATLVEDMVQQSVKGIDYDWDAEGITSAFNAEEIERMKEVFSEVNDIVAASAQNETRFKANAEAEKKRKEEERAQKKKEKEEAEKALAKRQDAFIKGGVKGVEKADADFKKSLENLEKALPGGIKVVSNETNTGYGIEVPDDVTEAQIGQAIGYLTRTDENSEYARGAFQAFIGDLANAAVAKGIYKSMIKAGAALAEKVEETTGRKLHGRSIERFARMALKCPSEYRDVSKPSTLYVKVTEMSSPKKKDGESKEDFKKRIKAHEEDRRKLYQAVKDGYIEDNAGTKHKVESVEDVSELVTQVQVKHGVIMPPDPNKRSAAQWLRQYFFATNIKANLVGVIEEGVAVLKDENGEHEHEGVKVTKISVAELTDLEEQAKNALETELYTDRHMDLKKLMDGKHTIQKPQMEEKDGKMVTVKDDDKNIVYEDVTVPALFTNPFSK